MKYRLTAVNGHGEFHFDNLDDALGGAKVLLEDWICRGAIITKTEPVLVNPDFDKGRGT